MPDPTPHAHKLILLVEDDVPTRGVLTAALEHSGYNVMSAWKKTDVLALMSAHSFDLVITDMIMPEIDGIEVITALRQFRPSTPILAISGGGAYITGEFMLKMAKSVGALSILVKPFELDDLLVAVEKALSGKTPAAGE